MSELSYRDKQAFSLGATLYVPAIHKDLENIVTQGTTGAHSIVICTEDAIHKKDLNDGLANIRRCLPHLLQLTKDGIQVFIRPRNPDVLGILLAMGDIDNVAGFVLPKFDAKSLLDWVDKLKHANPMLGVMPTIETKDVFNSQYLDELVIKLKLGPLASRVIAVRIGGNDLLSCLSLRRPRGKTIYDSPIGTLIGQLVGKFSSEGFHLTAPAFEHFEDIECLERELEIDRAYGFVGKTAIHPLQINHIERLIAPTTQEVQEARAILSDDAEAVFKLNGSMCEVATHSKWARKIIFMALRMPPER